MANEHGRQRRSYRDVEGRNNPPSNGTTDADGPGLDFRALFEAMDEGFYLAEVIFDEEGRPVDILYLDENPAAIRMTGRSLKERRLREIDPGYEEYWYETFGRVARTGKGERLELYAEPAEAWFNFYVFKPGDVGGNLIVVMFTDVTTRKRAEEALRDSDERQTFLLKLSDALRPLTDPAAIQAEACRLLGERLGADRAYYVEVSLAEGRAHVDQDYVRDDSPSLVGVHQVSDYGWCMPLYQDGQPVVLADTKTSSLVPDADRDKMAAVQIIAFVGIPLIKEKVWVGALCVTESAPRQWTEFEVELARETAERIWSAVERARAEAALRESEQRLHAIIEHLPGGAAFIVDRDLRFLLAGGEALHAAGFESQSLVGKTIFEALPPELAAGHEITYRKGLAGETFTQEHDAHGLTYFTRGTPLYASDGEVYAVLAVSYEMTERKHAEAALRENKERQVFLLKLSDTLRPLDDPIEIQETASRLLGEYLGVNRAAYAEAGPDGTVMVVARDWTSPDTPSVVGEYQIDDFGTFFTNPLREGRPSAIEDAANDPRVSRAAYPSTWGRIGVRSAIAYPLIKQGRLVAAIFIHQGGPRRWSDGEVTLVCDVGERTWAAIERARAEQSLKEADRRKDEFLATLAHELRNPLAPIRTGLELMRVAGEDRAMIADVRDTMEAQTRQLVRLVDDLLDMSRITRGRITLRKERVELGQVLRSALDATRSFIEESGHKLTLTLPPRPIHLDADPARLAQVLSNLLTNAAKYTPEGGEIRLAAERQTSDVLVTIKDTGVGIQADMLQDIFEMFQQIDRSLEQSQGGLGIGLTLVKQLVEMHGGSVEAHSEGPGRGSEFLVRLPLPSGEWPTAGGKDSSQTTDNAPPADKRRILIVDDNRDAARMLSMVVEMLGNEIRTAGDGLEAIDVAAEFQPEVVLMDLGMPRMNGYEAARRIREQSWGEKIILVALTGWGQEEDRRKTLDAGFNHHLVKPVEPAVLQALLAELRAVETQEIDISSPD